MTDFLDELGNLKQKQLHFWFFLFAKPLIGAGGNSDDGNTSRKFFGPELREHVLDLYKARNLAFLFYTYFCYRISV